MTNKLIFTNILLLFFTSLSVAQTKVVKVNAIKSNDYGVQYSLPKTNLVVNIEYTEDNRKAGPYARYASRYLGINDNEVTLEDQTLYTLDKVYVSEEGIPDRDNTYLVAFKSKTTSPFVYLTEEGIICTINAEYETAKENKNSVKENNRNNELPEINPQSIYTEEYLRAGSISKMAEVAAKNIYKIRESRQDILTGEADNVPKDGDAMRIVLANLDAQEKLWTELFTGSGEIKKHTKKINIEPESEINKQTLLRFSKYLGIVDKEDLSGSPIYINIKDLHTVDIPEEDPKRKSKEPESIVYNVPGQAEVEIYNGLKKIYSSTVNVTQFGTTQILGTSIFEDKKAPVSVLFYPDSGAIKQIIQ